MAGQNNAGGYIHKGLTRKNPKGMDDGSPSKPTTSVDKDATRGGIAPTPKTLGPRTA